MLVGASGALAAVAVGGGLVATDVLPGRTRLRAALGLTGDDGTVPDVEPGPMASGSFESTRRRGRTTAWAVSYPPGHERGDPLPVLVSLHGKGGTHRSSFDELANAWDLGAGEVVEPDPAVDRAAIRAAYAAARGADG